MLSNPIELVYQLVVGRFVFGLAGKKWIFIRMWNLKSCRISLPITPRYACPITEPASFDRIQLYQPASVSRTFEINKSPFSNTCTRPVNSTGVVSRKNEKRIIYWINRLMISSYLFNISYEIYHYKSMWHSVVELQRLGIQLLHLFHPEWWHFSAIAPWLVSMLIQKQKQMKLVLPSR